MAVVSNKPLDCILRRPLDHPKKLFLFAKHALNVMGQIFKISLSFCSIFRMLHGLRIFLVHALSPFRLVTFDRLAVSWTWILWVVSRATVRSDSRIWRSKSESLSDSFPIPSIIITDTVPRRLISGGAAFSWKLRTSFINASSAPAGWSGAQLSRGLRVLPTRTCHDWFFISNDGKDTLVRNPFFQ
jgi:hypothetical protein